MFMNIFLSYTLQKKTIALYENVKVLEDLKAKSDNPDKIKLSGNCESEELIEWVSLTAFWGPGKENCWLQSLGR